MSSYLGPSLPQGLHIPSDVCLTPRLLNPAPASLACSMLLSEGPHRFPNRPSPDGGRHLPMLLAPQYFESPVVWPFLQGGLLSLTVLLVYMLLAAFSASGSFLLQPILLKTAGMKHNSQANRDYFD